MTVYLLLATLVYLTYPKAAYAYLDPGTGSYFFQLLVGSLLGLLFTIKLFWKKIISFLRSKPNDSSKEKQN